MIGLIIYKAITTQENNVLIEVAEKDLSNEKS